MGWRQGDDDVRHAPDVSLQGQRQGQGQAKPAASGRSLQKALDRQHPRAGQVEGPPSPGGPGRRQEQVGRDLPWQGQGHCRCRVWHCGGGAEREVGAERRGLVRLLHRGG
ncbi:unnamed protein product [Effrenium voratum]|nr:unnamed protein product [Effrenium voratum]